MSYFDVLIETEKSIRQLAKEIGLPWTTLRDRLAGNTPPSSYRKKVPLELIVKANKLLLKGVSVRKVGKLLGVPKSTLHDQVNKYRSTLNEEKN